MKKFLEILLGREPALDELSDYWKKAATFMMILFSAIAFVTMLIINTITHEELYYIYLNIAGVSATVICLVVLRSTRRQELFTHIFVGFLFVASVLVHITIDVPRFEHFIACLLPIATIFLYNRKIGILIPACYYFIILILEILYGFFGAKYFVQYSMYYTVVTFMMYFIGYARTRTQEILELNEKEKAIYDSQTMLYSKTYMMQLMEENILNEKFFLMMFDIDNFKKINDTKGHVYGDRSIECLSEALRKVIKNGYCGRFGGDEFLVIRPYRKSIDVEDCAKKIQSEVNERIADMGITVSIGVVDKILNVPAAKLIYYADIALYSAKADGRNCMRMYNKID